MRNFLKSVSLISMLALSPVVTHAQDAAPDGPILFTNVDVFDGVNEALMKDVNVVITGNKISQISSEDVAIAGAQVIDGEGHTLMPGII